jgi:hypothetical protein
MSSDPTTAQERFEKLIADLTATESANAGAYDKAVLTLSSAALALSLTFAKDLAPFNRAVHLVFLFASWVCFVLALTINISGFMYSLHVIHRRKFTARAVFIHRKVSPDEFQGQVDREIQVQHRLNLAPGILFVAGVLCLASYVASNAWKEAHTPMADREKFPPIDSVSKTQLGTGVIPGAASTTAPVIVVPPVSEPKLDTTLTPESQTPPKTTR